jgi:hypothetical protein
VIVNRVWQWHFGRGLVGTPSDFGTRGDAPTHPELLDYLAIRFMDEGWSLKKLHKWIMLSSAYRQSSADRPDARGIDPENKLLWRMNRQRLDYESLRDSTLLAAGQLDRTIGGLPFSLTAFPAVPRRTIYAYVERGRLPGELNAFDFANPESHTPQRFQTTVPQQALFLMNSPFIAEEAKHLVAREEVQYAGETSARIRALYRIVFGRDPNAEEIELGVEYVGGTKDSQQEISAHTPWQYGMGEFKPGGLAFQPFAYFSMQRWQPASLLPQPGVGSAGLTATGGAPPDEPKRGVVRRWISPVSGEVEITGAIGHKIAKDEGWGDGVRARIILNGKDTLLERTALNQKSPMTVKTIQVQPGDTIDFVVDCLNDSENDEFNWSPVVQMKGTQKPTYWSALAGFHGPGPLALTVWEKYAQVLLETNEFAFID